MAAPTHQHRPGADPESPAVEQARPVAPAGPQPMPVAMSGLLVGRADDTAEVDADRMADSALARLRRHPLGSGSGSGPAPAPEPLPANGSVRRRGAGSAGVIGADGGALEAGAAATLRAGRGRGAPIPDALRGPMESAFDADFSDVRLHAGPTAARLNRTMSAAAFTHGRDIYFRDGIPDAGTAGGAHLLAHELAHVVQGGAPRVRRVLDRDQVLDAVESIDFLKQKLAGQNEGQKRNNAKSPEKIRDRVKGVLRQQATMFGSDDAMSMALAIDAVAQAVAEELYDTSLKPAIAQHLLTTFRDRIKKAMPEVGHRTKDLKTATALVSTDAVGRYMHGERKLGDAAWDIKEAAEQAKLKPAKLFELLSQKFQSQLASYSLTTVKGQQDTRGGFNESEITGSVSVNYLKELFGTAIDLTPDAKVPKNATDDGLEFSPAARKRLDDLGVAVQATTQPGAVDPRPKNRAERRARLFADVREQDAAIRPTREAQVRSALMAPPWNLSGSQATRLIGKLKSRLPELPLTITHDSDRRLPADVAAQIDSVDRSRAGVRQQVDVAGANFSSPGKWTGADRPENYMRFRSWKDRVMTGNIGMEGDEMPVFGAVNPFFKNAAGTGESIGDQYAATRDLRVKGKKNWNAADQKNADQAKKFRAKDHGKNYYGNVHLVLKRKRVEGRILYTASDHGVAHADPFLTFADFLLGSQGGYQADVTRLKRPDAGGFKDKSAHRPEQRATEIVQPEYAAAIVGSVLGSAKAVAWTLPFEVQIHGGVDWATDVSEIWVSTTTKDEVLDRLKAWSKANNGPKVHRAKPPSDDSNVSVVGDLAASGMKRARKRFG